MNKEWLDVLGREMVYQLAIEPHRIIVVIMATVGIYVSFMVLVKLFGSRVLSSMTASDAVIVIMFGAVAGRVIVGNPPTLGAGIVGLTSLMALEAMFGTVRRYIGWSKYLDRKPVLLMYKGHIHVDNLRMAHVSNGDLMSAVRKAGIGRLKDVQVMVLESTGQISIIRSGQPVEPHLLFGVAGAVEMMEKYPH